MDRTAKQAFAQRLKAVFNHIVGVEKSGEKLNEPISNRRMRLIIFLDDGEYDIYDLQGVGI